MEEHKPTDIKGYRGLSPEEVTLINQIKLHGETTRMLLEQTEYRARHLLEVAGTTQDINEEAAKRAAKSLEDYNELKRWMAVAKTHLQQGYMAWVRAVTRPESF